jgi:hypothetical protein
MAGHATRSPSGATRWSICTASVAEEQGKPDSSSDAADWGTAVHLVSATVLTAKKEALDYLGWQVVFYIHPESSSSGEMLIAPNIEALDPGVELLKVIDVDDEMVACAASYVARVREIAAGHTLLIEQSVPVDHITGEQGATGSADIVILAGDEIIVGDLKSGYDPVYSRRQDGRMNLQLAMYCSGALQKYELLGDFKRVRGIIFQPRLGHESEHVLTIDELNAEIETLRAAAKAEPTYSPGTDTCKYCKAFPCAAATEYAAEGFVDLDAPRRVADMDLGDVYGKLPFITAWVEGIEQRVRQRLEQGEQVKGWKLVEGNLGARSWANPAEVERLLVKQFRVGDDAFERKLVTPAKAEKLVDAKVLGPRQWKTLQPLIEQRRNKPSIAPESDKRPAFGMSAEGLPNLDCSDLF